MTGMSPHWLALCVLASLCAGAAALRCWQCGQYSDGVGSITPCTNHSAAKLGQCNNQAKYCIKYVSELTVVRDCVPSCTEKEWWGARTYCCDSDECNSGASLSAGAALLLAALGLLAAR
ncbi:uncharacterized protein LOC119692199 isoform X2 [Plutella xylostella]|uniref:uncharacterized protein LOC119692199 isoform X2 n=1 Tax=Plutella xylostella TaxID=51655 RepID=UPI0018D1F626|nr:uncharacterized protein LOC119692199 isoform X2 [Plutella xylostella]